MSREEIYEQLNEVFRDVFDDDTIEVNDQTTSRDIEDWDSLEHINLIAAIETQFGMKFTMGQVVTMKMLARWWISSHPRSSNSIIPREAFIRKTTGC